MSAVQTMQSPASNATHADAPTLSAPPAARRSRFRPGRLFALAVVVGLGAVGSVPVMNWIKFRRNHSITDDAFVEAHIVNVAPQLVSGRIIRFLVDENDRVRQGQVVAEVDPIPYSDKVNIVRAQLDSAQAELARQRADLDLVRKEVPIQIEIARRTFAAAMADRAKAEESLKYTIDEVEKGIDEARAGVKAA
jgi:membrane fusion protein, multidrug efflux system